MIKPVNPNKSSFPPEDHKIPPKLSKRKTQGQQAWKKAASHIKNWNTYTEICKDNKNGPQQTHLWTMGPTGDSVGKNIHPK